MTFLPALTGSFSHPAADNPTGVMVEAAYRHHGLDARYVNCDVLPDGLTAAVRGAQAMGWLGFNCSLPHKIDVIQLLDELTPAAEIIGAVNCVKIDATHLVGENTDGKGFLASLVETTPVDGRRLVLLGAGGAARAIAVEAALAGAAHITVLSRRADQAAGLAALIADRTPADAEPLEWSSAYAVPPGADVLVNATPIGMLPDVNAAPEVDLDSLHDGLVVADVVPNPPVTRLLRVAAERGCRTVNGLGMLVNQAVAGIKLWTGVDADPTVMHRALEEALGVHG